MNRLLADMLYCTCMVYLDDIICWADSLSELEEIVSTVIQRLRGVGLKLNGEKSIIVSRHIEVLGHDVKEGRIHPQVDKLEFLKRECTTLKDV